MAQVLATVSLAAVPVVASGVTAWQGSGPGGFDWKRVSPLKTFGATVAAIIAGALAITIALMPKNDPTGAGAGLFILGIVAAVVLIAEAGATAVVIAGVKYAAS